MPTPEQARPSRHPSAPGKACTAGVLPVMALTVALLSAATSGCQGLTGSKVQARPTVSAATGAAAAVRWKPSLDAFAEDDLAHPPVPGGVLFIGSSSIRMWKSLRGDFHMLPNLTQRGFGGSRLADVAELVPELVLPYRPSVIVVYAGDNDLAEGASPEDVLDSFSRFVRAVRGVLPATRIDFVSIKTSPRRAALASRIEQANALVEAYARTLPGLDYIDVASKMLTAEGQPRTDLYRDDYLHLNAAGYASRRHP